MKKKSHQSQEEKSGRSKKKKSDHSDTENKDKSKQKEGDVGHKKWSFNIPKKSSQPKIVDMFSAVKNL